MIIYLLFIQVYDELVDYLNHDEHIEIMAEELKSRNVQCTNFYDICLDYILIDSFEVRFLQTLKNMYLSIRVSHGLLNIWKELLFLIFPHEADLFTLIMSPKLTQYF